MVGRVVKALLNELVPVLRIAAGQRSGSGVNEL